MKLRRITESLIKEENDLIVPEEPVEETVPAEVEAEVAPVEAEPVSDLVKQTAIAQMLNDLIQHTWDYIASINSIIATIDAEGLGECSEDVKAILNTVLDDSTIDTGMLYKALNLVDPKTNELIDAGTEKAEEIIEK